MVKGYLDIIHSNYTFLTRYTFVAMPKESKTWVKTSKSHIYRHKSGILYARVSFGSKRTWKSLKTKLISIAVQRADEIFREARRLEALKEEGATIDEAVTVGQLVALELRQISNNVASAPATKHYWEQIFTALEKSWPELYSRQAKTVTADECEDWSRNYSKGLSATRFNNTVSGLRRCFDRSIKSGSRVTNPTSEIKRKKAKKKDLSLKLPSREQFHQWIGEIRNGGGRFSKASGDFVEFLAYSGLRISEAKNLQWQHCDFVQKEIIVLGDVETGTKNRDIRRVPMIPSMLDLLDRIQATLGSHPDKTVCRVNEAQKSMDRAGNKIGMQRITHHDLRHLFATTCIESGVDIPTLATWLGHKDGGVLAMKTYGHLRNEHSLIQAEKVAF